MSKAVVLIIIAFSASFFILGFGVATGMPIIGPTCNVAYIPVQGTLFSTTASNEAVSSNQAWTTADWVNGSIRSADKDYQNRAIILSVDSSGGEPTAGEEIARQLSLAKKPTVVIIRDTGASAAYWATLGADRIFASRNSYVGSIGVSYSYLDSSVKNKNEGLTLNVVESGKYKGIGNENRPLTDEERAIIERDVKMLHQNFVNDVALYRKLDKEKVMELADGSAMLGNRAKEEGLIDEVGGIEEAVSYLESQIGRVEVCYPPYN